MSPGSSAEQPRSTRFRVIAAVHILMLRGHQVLLVRRANTGYEDDNYSVVAGHLDGGEDVITASAREAFEEVGIHIQPAALRVIGVMHRNAEGPHDDERVDFFAAATDWTGEPANCEPDKCHELRWADLEDLPINTVPYVRRAIDNYRHGVWFDSFGWTNPRPPGET